MRAHRPWLNRPGMGAERRPSNDRLLLLAFGLAIFYAIFCSFTGTYGVVVVGRRPSVVRDSPELRFRAALRSVEGHGEQGRSNSVNLHVVKISSSPSPPRPRPPRPPPPPPPPLPPIARVEGLPDWYVWRSRSDLVPGYQYGLDKDDVLRQHAAQKLDCSVPAPKYKFYIYPLDIPARCHLHLKNITSKTFTDMMDFGQWVDEVFFYYQMLDHPWRTEDPSEAFLFYVPMLTSLSGLGMCGNWGQNMRYVWDSLEASPWYQRNQGADHLMFSMNYKIRGYIFRNPDFSHLIRKFICARQLYYVSELPDQCSIAMPHTSRMAVQGECGFRDAAGNGDANRLFCKSEVADQVEETFQAYKARRNYTLFCMGQADDRPTHAARKVAIKHLPNLRPPNYLVGVGTRPSEGRRNCTDGDVRSASVVSHVRCPMSAMLQSPLPPSPPIFLLRLPSSLFLCPSQTPEDVIGRLEDWDWQGRKGRHGEPHDTAGSIRKIIADGPSLMLSGVWMPPGDRADGNRQDNRHREARGEELPGLP